MADGKNGIVIGLSLLWVVALVAFGPMHLRPFLVVFAAGLAIALPFNLRGHLFLGDSGTYAISIVVGALTLYVYSVNFTALPADFVMLWFLVPVLDCLRLMVTRNAGDHRAISLQLRPAPPASHPVAAPAAARCARGLSRPRGGARNPGRAGPHRDPSIGGIGAVLLRHDPGPRPMAPGSSQPGNLTRPAGAARPHRRCAGMIDQRVTAEAAQVCMGSSDLCGRAADGARRAFWAGSRRWVGPRCRRGAGAGAVTPGHPPPAREASSPRRSRA